MKDMSKLEDFTKAVAKHYQDKHRNLRPRMNIVLSDKNNPRYTWYCPNCQGTEDFMIDGGSI